MNRREVPEDIVQEPGGTICIPIRYGLVYFFPNGSPISIGTYELFLLDQLVDSPGCNPGGGAVAISFTYRPQVSAASNPEA